MPFEFDYSTN